jgi:hypothetical protein
MAPCTDFRPQLSAFVDGQLGDADRATVDAHVVTCAHCAALVRDLERIRDAARTLAPIDPPPHLWLELAGRIRLDAGGPAVAAAPARAGHVWQWVGLAAALVLVTLGAYGVRVFERHAAERAASNTTAAASVEAFASELEQATSHYQKAIADLETITKTETTAIDPTVSATLQKNLTMIDSAIAESQAAVAANPESAPAKTSLLDALQRKVTVLQETVALMNDMRRGDQTGAAQAAAGLSKKS